MLTGNESGFAVTRQCPLCIGTGRLYPESVVCRDDSNGTTCVGLSGLDCPNCQGLGSVQVQLRDLPSFDRQ